MAQTPSRPFRSLGLFLIGWVCFRMFVTVGDEPSRVVIAPAPVAVVAAHLSPRSQRSPTTNIEAVRAIAQPTKRARYVIARTPPTPVSHALAVKPPLAIFTKATPLSTNAYSDPQTLPRGASGWREPDETKKWSVSAWLLARDDGPVGLGTGGELGGSQAGARAFYGVAEPVAVTARISRPLARPDGGEASIGIALRHRNVGILVERRIALDRGGRNDFSVTAYGGVSDVPLGYGVSIEGYAQAGVVGSDAFADGALRAERPVATQGKVRISAGAGTWAGIQPGAKRVDVGPQIVAHIPTEGANVRIAAEWRERVAGDAAPRSGPSLTIGVDF